MSEDITHGLPQRSFEERVLSELSGIRQGLTTVNSRLSAVEDKVTTLDGKIDLLDERLTSVEGQMTSLEDKIDARLRETRPIWEGVLARLTTIESRLGGIESELARMNRQFRSFVADNFQLRVRVEKLEEDKDTQTA